MTQDRATRITNRLRLVIALTAAASVMMVATALLTTHAVGNHVDARRGSTANHRTVSGERGDTTADRAPRDDGAATMLFLAASGS